MLHTPPQRESLRQLKRMRGTLATLTQELTRLRDRHRKLDACLGAEAASLRAMLAGDGPTASACPRSPPASLLGDGAYDPILPFNDGSAPPREAASSWRSVHPIGWIRSPFVEKNGTPRQGVLAPSARAVLRVRLGWHPSGTLNEAHTLEGLANFSHVWLLFCFDRDESSGTKSKVKPPRLDGVRTGIYSTRTPHRPNQIGLSLVRLDSVEADTLHLSAVDLCDGTPVLDVKPYVPFADSIVGARVAPWLSEMPTNDLRVEWSDGAEAQLRSLVPSLEILEGWDGARSAIVEVLTADPRSVHWRQSRTQLAYGFSIDTLNVVCAFCDNVAYVQSVQHIQLSDRSHVPAADTQDLRRGTIDQPGRHGPSWH